MTVSAGRGVVLDGFEAVTIPGAEAGPDRDAILCRRSAQPSRRAVLHVLASGDAVPPFDLATGYPLASASAAAGEHAVAGEHVAPAELAAWFTERAFHFYLARLRLPARPARSARQARRAQRRGLRRAFAVLDAASAHLSESEGIEHLIVTAQGPAAVAAALWCEARTRRTADRNGQAEALVLLAPTLPTRGEFRIEMDCPVLVLAGEAQGHVGSRPGGGGFRPSRGQGPRPLGWWHRLTPRWQARAGSATPAVRLGSHVTWLRLRDDPGQCFAELGRWLGAYMYGPLRDQLL